MPTMDDLAKLANQLYKGNPGIMAYGSYYHLQWDQDAATSLGFTSPDFYLWSDEELNSGGAYARYCDSTISGYSSHGMRGESSVQAFCIAD